MEQPQSSSTPGKNQNCLSDVRPRIFNTVWFTAPTSSTNPEEEDIDIVGCEGDNGNKTNNSGNLSSSESSRDLQLHVYGPPQFTEADVLACMNALEHEDDEDMDNDDDKKSEATAAMVAAETLTQEQPAIKREMDSENENENEVMMPEQKDTVDNKENIADKSKCSKCLVSPFLFCFAFFANLLGTKCCKNVLSFSEIVERARC